MMHSGEISTNGEAAPPCGCRVCSLERKVSDLEKRLEVLEAAERDKQTAKAKVLGGAAKPADGV